MSTKIVTIRIGEGDLRTLDEETLARAILRSRSDTPEWQGSARASDPTRWDRLMAKRVIASLIIFEMTRAHYESLDLGPSCRGGTPDGPCDDESCDGHGRASVEIHEDGEWSAVYLNGRLIRVGDTYLADEWVRDHFGVLTVQDDAFMRGQSSRDGVAQTLEEVLEYARVREERLSRGAALRAEAARLVAEADALTKDG